MNTFPYPSIIAKSKELDAKIAEVELLKKQFNQEKYNLHKELFDMKNAQKKVADVLTHIKTHPNVSPMIDMYEKYLPNVKKGWYVPVILVLVYLAIKKNSDNK